MVWEALHPGEEQEAGHRVSVRELLVLGVATSIDALAVGISLAFLDVAILEAAAIIGVTTFALSLGGVYLGHRAGSRFRGPAEVTGGLILIGIGIRVLLDHLGVW
jgi:putative Mn2+ efflux pump MntP